MACKEASEGTWGDLLPPHQDSWQPPATCRQGGDRFWGCTYSAPRSAVLLHWALPAERGLGHTHRSPQLHQGLVKIPRAAPVYQGIGHVPGRNSSERRGALQGEAPGPLPTSCLQGAMLLGRQRLHSSFLHRSQRRQLPKSFRTPRLSPFTGSAPCSSPVILPLAANKHSHHHHSWEWGWRVPLTRAGR